MNQNTFGGIPAEFADASSAKIYLQSIPYDGTSTWGKGADQGFKAFMDAAENMELYDIETDSEVYKQGIHLLSELSGFSSPEEMFQETYRSTKKLLTTGKFLTLFGGEHSISIGPIKAYYEHFENLTILQIDAHADLRPQYHGTPYNHACAVYDASRNANLLQVGIRSMELEESANMDRSKIWFAQDMYGHDHWMEESITKMTDKVYITFDLDAFDPGVLPGTGTPEPGGLGWYETLHYLKKVFTEREVVGFDIVELAPIEGNPASQFAAAKLYYKMLTYKFCQS